MPFDCRSDSPAPGIWLLYSPSCSPLSRHSDSVFAYAQETPSVQAAGPQSNTNCLYRVDSLSVAGVLVKRQKKKKKKKNRLTIEYTKCTVRLLSYWICSKGSLWGFLASFMISLRSRPGSLAGEAAWPSAHPSDSHFLPGQIGQNQQDLHCAVHLPTSAWMFPTDSTAH